MGLGEGMGWAKERRGVPHRDGLELLCCTNSPCQRPQQSAQRHERPS